MNKELIYKNACEFLKEAKKKDNSNLNIAKKIGIGAGLLAAPVAAAYALQKPPDVPKRIKDTAKKGITFVEGKTGKDIKNLTKNKAFFFPGYKSVQVTGTPPKKPVYRKGIVVLQDPYQTNYIKGDITLNKEKSILDFEDKFKEQKMFESVGKYTGRKYHIKSVDITPIVTNPKLDATQRLKKIKKIMDVNKMTQVVAKENLGAASHGAFPTEKNILETLAKKLKKKASVDYEYNLLEKIASNFEAKIKKSFSKMLSPKNTKSFFLQERLPLKKGIEFRVHTLNDKIIKSQVSPRYTKSLLKNPLNAHQDVAEKHVKNFLGDFYKKYPKLKNTYMEFNFDVGIKENGKPVLLETNVGGLSGFLDQFRRRPDYARFLKGKRSIHKAVRTGLPLGIAGVTSIGAYNLGKKKGQETNPSS